MDIDFLNRLSALESRFKKFSMVGTSEVLVAGNLKTGFMVNVNREPEEVTSPTPPATGACCLPTNECQIRTETSCINAGGTYQGDGTPCEPNPCPTPCDCTCEVDPETPIPCRIAGTITLNCDCEVLCGVSVHIEEFDQALTGTGCQCFLTTPFVYEFDCGSDPGCSPCHIVGGIIVQYDYDAAQWFVEVIYGYSNAAFAVYCSFAVTFYFDFSGGGPVVIDEDVPNGLPSSSCVSHINLTIT